MWQHIALRRALCVKKAKLIFMAWRKKSLKIQIRSVRYDVPNTSHDEDLTLQAAYVKMCI